MGQINKQVALITERIIERSAELRSDYLRRLEEDSNRRPERGKLSCGNLAHGFAACSQQDKDSLRMVASANIGIVTAYNDMLSAHQPYATYRIKSNKRCAKWDVRKLQAVSLLCVTVSLKGRMAWSLVC